jgi:cell wall-associated NlpC family hydrolase
MSQPATVSRADWLAWLLSLEGTPYQHQGRTPGVAMDCVAPLVCGAVRFGHKPPGFDFNGYSREPDGSLKALLDANLVPIERDRLQVGDAVLNGFRLEQPRHLAIIVGEAFDQWVMLHASSVVGRMQQERIQYNRRLYRFVQGYRLPWVQA